MKIFRVLLPGLLMLAACGDSADKPKGDSQNMGGGDGDGDGDGDQNRPGDGDGDGDGDTSEPGGLTLEVSVTHMDMLFVNTPGLAGSVIVAEGGERVTDAKVTVNGTELVADDTLEFYLIGPGLISGVGAGQNVTVTATRGGKSASLTLPCPEEVSIVEPAENTLVNEGDNVTIKVSRPILVEPFSPVPIVGVRMWVGGTDNFREVGTATQLGTAAVLEDGATTATVKAPMKLSFDDGYVTELSVPGKQITQGESSGECSLSRRVMLTTSQ
jgi:hypothetical protein